MFFNKTFKRLERTINAPHIIQREYGLETRKHRNRLVYQMRALLKNLSVGVSLSVFQLGTDKVHGHRPMPFLQLVPCL